MTKRMLDMFKRENDADDKLEQLKYPAGIFSAMYLAGLLVGAPGTMEATASIVPALCCIGGVAGLSSQKTARLGSALGMFGVASGILVTLGGSAAGMATVAQAAAAMGLGGTAGVFLARRLAVTDLPQTVAAFHSLVGLAAMLTCGASYINEVRALLLCETHLSVSLYPV